ncbi:hypothetical protein BTUL_0031g00230 [Botrytis tulipae]|uniref:MACPF domain-containing protein n=1 Tax=Botrytis tulipae TaxID=87230 RepID=A0A4Z1EY95_9HELO|nr:hypothetical protein BTUL_0031g00230 [Botrytis tulipae]
MDSTIDSQHEGILPICTTVGYTVNLLPQGVDPFDLSAILESDHKYNFLKHADTGEEITVPGSTRKYWLPGNFEKHETGSTTVANSLACQTAIELASTLKVDSKLAASYLGFSAEASAGYEYSTSFKKDEFIDAAAKLPTWKPISKDLKDFNLVTDIYSAFAHFYSRYGSHLIQEAYMGTRYQLKVEQNETMEEEMKGFSTNIKADNCNVLGGDAGKAGTLAHLSPDDADAYNAAFKEWQESREEGSTDALLHIRVMEIGSFLKDSYVKSQLAVADRLSSAWSYFKNFYTFQGQISVEKAYQDDVIKLEITPLPGLVIHATGTDIFTVTQTKASSVELTPNKDCSWPHLNVTIVAPDMPVQLLFTEPPRLGYWYVTRLQLNQCGPNHFQTNYNTSDVIQNVRSFSDAHGSEVIGKKVAN